MFWTSIPVAPLRTEAFFNAILTEPLWAVAYAVSLWAHHSRCPGHQSTRPAAEAGLTAGGRRAVIP